jgi:hypothetical protein
MDTKIEGGEEITIRAATSSDTSMMCSFLIFGHSTLFVDHLFENLPAGIAGEFSICCNEAAGPRDA